MFILKNVAKLFTVFLMPTFFVSSVWCMQQPKNEVSKKEKNKFLSRCEKSLEGKNVVQEWLNTKNKESTVTLLDELLERITEEKPTFCLNEAFSPIIMVDEQKRKHNFVVCKPANINAAIYKEICFDIMHISRDEKSREKLLSALANWFVLCAKDKNRDVFDIFKKLGGLFKFKSDLLAGAPDSEEVRASMLVRLLLAIYDNGDKKLAKELFTYLQIQNNAKSEEEGSIKPYTPMCFYSGVYFACVYQETIKAFENDETKEKAENRIKTTMNKILDVCGSPVVTALQECKKPKKHQLRSMYTKCLEEVANLSQKAY